MYGLILEGIGDAVRRKFGDEIWEETRKKAGVPHHSFNMHKTYSETVIPRLAKAGSEVTGRPIDELMELCGYSFVAYVSPYGYDRVLRVLGRHVRDFLNGLDNLHEYLRFSYPKLKPPSFFCENETRHGLTLHYRSKRRGFVYYVMGQITQLAKTFYNTPMEIELLSEEESMDMTHVVMKLHFDNPAFDADREKLVRDTENMPVSSDLFFDTFPFHIVFNSGMSIMSIGSGLAAVMPHIVGNSVDEMFSLTRPLIEFTMENVVMHLNNVFEVTSIDAIRKNQTGESTGTQDEDDDPDDHRRRLKLKGQMMHMEEWDACLFLGTPIMENLDKMFNTGLFINDLSMHDCSRDLVLAGTQQQAELQMAMTTEKIKSAKLEQVSKDMDTMDTKVNSLLCNYVPRAISGTIIKGEPISNFCAAYDNTTLLVSDIHGFSDIVTKAAPTQAFGMVNAMCAAFDALVTKNKCFRMEGNGDQYVVCCGAPVATKYHALYICDLALDMMAACAAIANPCSGFLLVKIGIMTGQMKGGVMGHRVPVFQLFGENAMAAFKIAECGTAGKIHVSEPTKNDVSGYSFDWEDAGQVDCKNKGAVKTYFLTQRSGGSGISLHAQVDETADVSGNISGYVPESGAEPDFSSMFKPVK